MTALMTRPLLTIAGVEYRMHLARIEATRLGRESYAFTYYLDLAFDGSNRQSAGGRFMDDHGEVLPGEPYTRGPRRGTAYGCDLIMRTLEVVGVAAWEQLRSQRVYALKQGGLTSEIAGLANIDNPEGNHLLFRVHAAKFL